MVTMLDYEYHYPLTPIQSASHDIHPAFRNDPELADVVNVNGSTFTLVPPPRNPLRTPIKPLFSASATEAIASSVSLAQALDETSKLDVSKAVTANPPISPVSPRSCTTHSTSSQASYKQVYDSTPLPPYERFSESELALNAPKPVTSPPSLPKPPSQPSSTVTARTLCSLPCPPSLLPQEWSFFLKDLQSASSLSKGQKGLVVAVALAVPICCPIIKGLIGWGVWRNQTMKNIRLGLDDRAAFEKKRKRESVESVVQRWNARWEERGVRVKLEVRTKDKKIKGENGRLRVLVTEFEASQTIDDGYESEDDIDFQKEFK